MIKNEKKILSLVTQSFVFPDALTDFGTKSANRDVLVKEGREICSTRQATGTTPNCSSFVLFDDLYLMSRKHACSRATRDELVTPEARIETDVKLVCLYLMQTLPTQSYLLISPIRENLPFGTEKRQ